MSPNQAKVIKYIEHTFGKIIDDIQVRPCGGPSIVLKRITEQGSQIIDREMVVSLPGKNQQEAWKFTCIAKILSEMYSAIRAGETVTKRDIYYRDPKLFKSQSFVDRYVDIIAYTCGVTRLDLNVTASPKGIVLGIHLGSEEYEVIPDKSVAEIERDIIDLRISARWRWILVVEKEATFKGLAERKFWQGNDEIGPGVLVTAKGYPDMATRRFLRACANEKTHSERSVSAVGTSPKVFGLFDCDPDGINILDVYRNGSRLLPHEKISSVPELIWLGLKPLDAFTNFTSDAAALALTTRDTERATAMLKRSGDLNDQDSSHGLEEGCCSALRWMKMLNRKAEIEILHNRPEGLGGWLNAKIVAELNRLC